MKRLFTSLVAAVALLLCACGGQAQESPWQTAYRETGQYLLSQPAPTTGSIGGEWAVIGLRRAGLLTDEMARSYKAAARIMSVRPALRASTAQNPRTPPAPSLV